MSKIQYKVTDIKGIPPMILDGSGLKQMFDLQETLMGHLIVQGKLVPYPLELGNRKSQALVKDMIGCFTEELAEANQVYHKMLYNWSVQKNMEEMPQLILDFNEEIADATHFLLETLILCDIAYTDVESYLKFTLDKLNFTEALFVKDNPLRTGLSYGRRLNAAEGLHGREYKMGYKIPISKEDPLVDLLQGGRIIGPNNTWAMENIMWAAVCQSNLAKNFLKNRPWKTQDTEVDVEGFINKLMEATIFYFRLLDFIGMDEFGVFTTYWYKNQVNLRRVETNY